MLRSRSLLVSLLLPALLAADWPQWRGPNRDDVSTETGLQSEWAANGPSRLWLSKDVGIGYSGFSVVGDTLYTMGAKADGEHLIAVNVADGTTKWSTLLAPLYINRWGDGPRCTPTIDGERVFTLSGKGILACVNRADGLVIWKVDLKDFGGSPPNWGYCESVLIDGEKCLCTPGNKEGAILALDKRSGEKIWQSKDFTDGAQYASIIVAEHGGKRQYIQLTQKNFVGIDAATGDVLWTAPFDGRTAVIPTPIYHDGCVYVASGYGAGCKMIRLSSSNEAEEVYVNKNMTNHHGGVVLVGDHLYGYSDGKGWICQNFQTGEIVWSEKNKLGKGSLTCAGGKLYCYDERKGEVVLIDATPAGWQEHGRFKIDPQTTLRSPSGGIWTHPVVANGKLFLRDQDLLACYDIKAN
ncbi:MAG: PQQ-binding-like beta-propeller repeat protein [Pirellulaceae bacterium]|nr:PQQ-binding-like beta-propeller repeat protein [Pirellulaceae bacterium]